MTGVRGGLHGKTPVAGSPLIIPACNLENNSTSCDTSVFKCKLASETETSDIDQKFIFPLTSEDERQFGLSRE